MNVKEVSRVNERTLSALNRMTRLAIVALCVMCLPVVSAAQTGSAITGVATDATGAVLPGVTVEASSPALIEGVRVGVTDGQGVYRIVNLSPGTYSVNFSLPGFGAYVREGIQLGSSFTATVDGVLTVGGIAETITVTGEAPLVDTQNVAAVEQFSRETIEELPISKTTGAWAALIPAMKPRVTATAAGGVDVGGTQSERAQAQVTVHGGPDDIQIIKGGMEAMRGVYSMNRVDTQEVVVQMGGNTAEAETGGVRINIVPREGGNVFSGTFEVDGTSEALQGSNGDANLEARGLSGTPYVKKAYNAGGGIGGPIVRGKLWFFGSYRKWATESWLPGKYYNATQGTPFYTPDLGRLASSNDYYASATARMTWAATSQQKFNFSYEHANNCNCLIRLITSNRAPESVGDHKYFNRVPQGTWQWVASNRLLVEVGVAYYNGFGSSDPVEGVGPNDLAYRELTTNFRWGSRADNIGGSGAYADRQMRRNYNERINVSYVTGSHNFKIGARIQQWPIYAEYSQIGSLRAELRNGVPNRVQVYTSPLRIESRGDNLGLYVQDQWTMDRVTLNLGLRYDAYSGYAPETSRPAGIFAPARTFAKSDTLTDLQDINLRAGVAYDVFGDGRTALKGFIGRFVVATSGSVPGEPATQTVNNARRSWNDANGDFIPQESELGRLSNSAFGTPRASALTVDEALAFGWGNRGYNWQGILSLDHEITQGVGMQIAYYRTWHGNMNFHHNVALSMSDYDPYCFNAPTDSRLGSVSGAETCGLFDISPDSFGVSDIHQSLGGDGMKRLFNGVDINLTGRIGGRLTLAGGLALGNSTFDNCGVIANNVVVELNGDDVNSVGSQRFCKNTYSWQDDVQLKLNGTLALPLDFRTSFVFQNLPGAIVGANYFVSSTAAAASLGRSFSGGNRQTDEAIPLLEPWSRFEDRTTILDLRLSKRFVAGGTSFTGNLDLANALNNNAIQAVNSSYGSRWLDVNNAMSARVIRLGLQVEF